MGVVTKGCGHKGALSKFLRMLQTCPGFLIPKLGNYVNLRQIVVKRTGDEQRWKRISNGLELEQWKLLKPSSMYS